MSEKYKNVLWDFENERTVKIFESEWDKLGSKFKILYCEKHSHIQRSPKGDTSKINF